MPIPILATKLYIPPPRTNLVPRARLIERLNEGLRGKLTLISAPAGFGKTTLVSEWIIACHRPTAWLSLEEGDSTLTRFLTYFIAAMQTLIPNLGEGVLAILPSPQPPPTEAILTALLNEIVTFPNDFLFVLDDYHLIDARPIDEALTFLLAHLPPQMHLVITTREDPNIPLARLRARRQLTELRAADLRFTPSEASDFLNRIMGLSLSVEAVEMLETRTEGWIAGLQLAAVSMQSHHDVPQFIRAFAGDNHYVVDYLIEEVLEHQPEPVRRFLLQTAILDQMNGVLCDAVTGQQDGNARLEALNRGNFFLIPLDNQRRWYRYHHLFAEVLRIHLMAEQPDQIAVLHRRASEWYEQNGSVSDAIRHALSGQDFGRAAYLIEMTIPHMRRNRQESTLLGWLQFLPDEVLRCRPVLCVHYAGALLQSGTLEGAESLLRDAERWLDAAAGGHEQPKESSAEMVVADAEEFRGLAGTIAMYRAAIALTLGDLTDTLKYAQRVLELAAMDDHLRHGAATAFVGLVNWTKGNLEAARQSYLECMARLQKVGFISDVIGCSIALADMWIVQGYLREAKRTYEQGLQLATQGTSVLRGAADMYVGMSQLHYEHNDLDLALQHLQKSKELGDLAGLLQNPYRWQVVMARIQAAQGDLEGAFNLLQEAERLYAGDFSPNVRPIPALKARVWAAQGRWSEALTWAHEQRLSLEDDLSYLREFEHITLSRILLAQYQHDPANRTLLDAISLLERLLGAAEAGDRTGSVIEILILLALAHQMEGDIPAALSALERALTLAEPEGYIRMFVDEGYPMTLLLEKAVKNGIMPNYAHQLLRASGKVEERTPIYQGLSDSLSEREIEVLRLLRSDLDGPEIARELVVSLNTIRTHTKNIYTKLGVNSRRAAVRRAEELGLF
ncbi:MAG: helix-turn-helix transcriptional regulator [Anaerolineae bacterium]|nr:helix-turn-helix transcriptional regulator [Anaerolineae bacterium]